MIFRPTKLAGSYTIELQPFQDDRGWFARTYCADEFRQIGHDQPWVQLNHSFTAKKGTIRGMHYQLPPFSEIKMVRCVAGAVHDVIIDIREGSPTFLQHVAIELSAANKTMIYIPQGFAHGFQALTDDCELLYHHSQFYQPGVEGGIKYNDPAIAVSWPLPLTYISQRDNGHPLLGADFKGI